MESKYQLINIDPQDFANENNFPEIYEEFINIEEYDVIEEKYRITDAEIEEKVAKCELLNGEEKESFWDALKKYRRFFSDFLKSFQSIMSIIRRVYHCM